jgi:signal transduction histidine kinase
MLSVPMSDDPERLRSAYEERVRALTETVEKRDRELAILAEVAARVHGEADVARILDIALEEIVEQMGLKTAWVFMGDEKEKKLRLVASRGVSAAYLDEIHREGLKDCLCPEVFWTGHRMQARNTTQCPRMPTIVDGLTEPVAHACIPLVFEGASRGVLNVAARPGEQFSDDELRFLDTLGHQVCIAVERASHLRAEALRNEEARRAYQDLKGAQERILQAEKMAVLGTFASGLAHEVRNPLNSIGLQLSILERRLARGTGGNPAEVAEIVGVIREEIKRLDSLVGDFLLFSRTNRMQYGAVRLDALVDDVVRLLRPEARSAKVALRRHPVGGELPEMQMDAERMKQVVINLVRNAIEALDGRPGEVVVETGLVDGRASLVVQDDGPGLPPDLDVFQLFVTTKDKGTGLGLSIAQQIVLEHGGEIVARSEAGRGATFAITLPVEPLAEARQEGRKT